MQTPTCAGQCVCTLSAVRWRNHGNEAGTEASLDNPSGASLRTALLRGRITPLAVENSVGESAAHEAPNADVRERERGELPPPPLPRLIERSAGAQCFLGQ